MAKQTKKDKLRTENGKWLQERASEGKFLASVARDWTLTSILEELEVRIDLGWERLEGLLGLAQGKFAALDRLAEEVRKVQLPQEWEPSDYMLARAEGREPTLDEVVAQAKLSPIEVAGGLAALAFMLGIDKARLILAVALPEVVKAAAENGILGEGATAQMDRKMLMEAGGLVAKGANTIVNVNQVNNTTAVLGLPKWEDVDKVVEGTYFEDGGRRLREGIVARRELAAAQAPVAEIYGMDVVLGEQLEDGEMVFVQKLEEGGGK